MTTPDPLAATAAQTMRRFLDAADERDAILRSISGFLTVKSAAVLDRLAKSEAGYTAARAEFVALIEGAGEREAAKDWVIEAAHNAITDFVMNGGFALLPLKIALASLDALSAAGPPLASTPLDAARPTHTPAPLRPEWRAWLAASLAIVADMTREEREAMWESQRQNWVRGNMEIDR